MYVNKVFLLCIALDIGAVNLKVTQMLEDAHKHKFGAMEPTEVRASGVQGKCILVSGHDLFHLKVFKSLFIFSQLKSCNCT